MDGGAESSRMTSIWADKVVKVCSIWVSLSIRRPLKDEEADLSSASDSALIKSIIASAAERDILPLRKARLLNSPARAGVAPWATRWSRIRWRSRLPPCAWISTTSSPVKLCGAGKCIRRASSVRLGVWILVRVATRGLSVSGCGTRAKAKHKESAPLRRIMPTPELPVGVATAAIVVITIV